MRITSLLCALMVVFGAMGPEASACGLSRWFGGPAARTTFYAASAPYVAAYAPATYTAYYPAGCAGGCAVPLGVYRAKTYYRVAYPAPVAQPVGGCATCVATAVTTYRPVLWPWRVGWAYTTRRVLYANPCPLPVPCMPACGACVDPCAGACAAPALSSSVSTFSPGCACGTSAAPSSTPTTTYYAPPAQTIVPPAPAETAAPEESTQPRKTFEQEQEQEGEQEQIDLKPIPESGPIPETGSPTTESSLPRLLEPQGPTALRQLHPATRLVPVAFQSGSRAGSAAEQTIWRPSHQ